MTKEEFRDAVKALCEKVSEEEKDLHALLLVTSIKDNMGDAMLSIAGDLRIIAYTLGDAIDKTPELRDLMVFHAMEKLMLSEGHEKIDKNN